MSDTIQKYKDYVMTGFMKSVVPIVIDHASGATVTDDNGREYLDCFAGISVVNAGHCNPQVIAAAKAQMDKLVHCSSYIYHVQPVADLAEKIAQIAPRGLTKTFFGNGGAEAIEGAMKLARLYTGKHEFIALHASFHGRSWGTLSITGNLGRKKRGGPYAPGVAFAPAPYAYRSQWRNDPEECGRQCAKAIDDVIRFATSGDVAAFIAEPVMGEGGIIVPPPNYFKEVKKVLDQHGILFIADEVQSGFARTGKMFAIEHYGVVPDILVTAKGIADGFPAERLYHASGNRRRLQAGRPSFHLRWQSHLLRRRPGQHQFHGERKSPGPRHRNRELCDGQAARVAKAELDHRRSARPGPDDRRRTGERRKTHASHHRSRSHSRRPATPGRAGRRRRRLRQRNPLPAAADHHAEADRPSYRRIRGGVAGSDAASGGLKHGTQPVVSCECVW